ncbi:UpxY family transcription antiterminator [Phocaeicola barnesiae]|uniref:UpxY family transcription antiterminator n=1 Tax=Phocaeicola barnesiae TaxID=376804 RepID=UPI0025A3B75F|nr:UpxY family transcription antiterminator [Phocaeicola barnesiae]MDM8234365.1 UpxY family transcription antiterminator [Phocaeicola barnesiae]
MTDSDILWFVMRDLTHYHSKSPAYKMLDGLKIENFTPKVQKLVVRGGKRERIEVPFIHDLIFVHDSRLNIDPIVEKVPTFQYRFLRDGKRTPMTVREADMERFKKALEVTDNHYFYTPQEVKPDMIGKKVRIVGGPLDGYEGNLQKMQGSRVKRLFVELPNLLIAAVEVQPEFIQIVK